MPEQVAVSQKCEWLLIPERVHLANCINPGDFWRRLGDQTW